MSQGQGGGRKPRVFTPEEIIQVEALGAVLSLDQIADYFGVGRTTLASILDRQPEVAESYKKGKAKAISSVATTLLKKAREGNISAAIFYLKTQAGWREKDRAEDADGNPIPVQVNIVMDKNGQATECDGEPCAV